jgi:lipopolysaccharide export system permease protein
MLIVDRYLIKEFLQTILFGLIAFTVLFVVIDMMENLDDFIDQNVTNDRIMEYYIVFIPEIIRLIIPIAVLLAALFTVGKLSTQNELAALKAGGLSFYRFAVPFLAATLIISLFTIYFAGWIVPKANKQKVFIEQTFMKKNIVRSGVNIFFQDSNTRIVQIAYYDPNRNIATRTSIQEFDATDITKMVSRIDATSMSFDTTSGIWTMHNATKRIFHEEKQQKEKFNEFKMPQLNFKPEDVIRKQQKTEDMTLTELSKFAQDQLNSGNDPTRIEIEYHSRIAFAFSSIIVVLFGLPLSANKRRGGLAIQFGICLLVTFIYLVFMKVSQAFGKNGVLDPLLTAWFANIFFFIAAIVNIVRARK